MDRFIIFLLVIIAILFSILVYVYFKIYKLSVSFKGALSNDLECSQGVCQPTLRNDIPACPYSPDDPMESIGGCQVLYFMLNNLALLEYNKEIVVPPGTTSIKAITYPLNTKQPSYFSNILKKTDEPDGVGTYYIFFRGTITKEEWEKDLQLEQSVSSFELVPHRHHLHKLKNTSLKCHDEDDDHQGHDDD